MENKSKLDVKQAAEDWSGFGVYCVPLLPKLKRPRANKWQHLRLVSDDFGRAFKLGDNLGGIWGKPSGWAVDLDLDLDTAPEVAKHILKGYDTFVFGRKQKRDSHYIFKCINAQTHKWVISGPDEVGTVVEIRSTGSQSVLPPSVHPSGDRYIIEEDREFARIKKNKLESLAEEIAIAAVMLHYYPANGRHDYVHACAGALCHAKWAPGKIKRVMGAVLSCVNDEELADRLGSVINTIKLHREGGQVKGLTTLKDSMTPKTITALRAWFKGGTKESLMVASVSEHDSDSASTSRIAIAPVVRSRALDFKEKWLDVPGLVGDIIQWSHKRAYIKQPIFDLACGLMCVSHASNNNYLVGAWETPLSPYIMVTAPTGGGKDSVLSAITEFSREIGMPLPFRGFQSYYALLDTLAEDPVVCLLWDEAARNLAAAKSINSPDFQTITHLISLYGAGNKTIAATPGRNKTIPPLENPFLCLLATAQPDMLMESLTSTAQETGFINRFILFDTGANDLPPLNLKRTKVFPSALKKAGKQLMLHHPMGNGEKGSTRFTEVDFDTHSTFTMFQEFEEAARARTLKREYTWSRANQNALILAGLVAIGVDPVRPKITYDIAEWAMEVITWSCDCWEERVRQVGAGSMVESQSKRVERMIRYPQDFIHLAGKRAEGRQATMLKGGFMPASVLIRGTRSIPKYRLDEIINTLHDAELIGSVDKNGVLCYFAKE